MKTALSKSYIILCNAGYVKGGMSIMIKEIAENEIMNIVNEKVKEHVNKIEESIKDEKQFNDIQSCIDKI